MYDFDTFAYALTRHAAAVMAVMWQVPVFNNYNQVLNLKIRNLDGIIANADNTTVLLLRTQ